ncbi:MAG: rhomboid family intramembrane serine protease [Reichenbachiella sp.]|uniref:rhomboid family intramembrane serine protease n=1 Tax=Reichenbachiella sp. TaxID=2184521 RepID=UPI00329A3696
MKKRTRTRDQLIPFQWFWTDEFGEKMGFREWFKSRKFTISYLITIWTIVSVLDFASTLDCTSTWQLAFACDHAIWMGKMITDPLNYVLSWFTAPFFHNSIDHILFVTVIGMMMPVQSFEVQYGSKATAIVFIVSYIWIGVFCGIFFNLGVEIWPEMDFMSFTFKRNWMGGSVGFYGLIGALVYCSRKPWILFSITFCFELLNLFVIKIDPQITFAHANGLFIGYCCVWLMKKQKLI